MTDFVVKKGLFRSQNVSTVNGKTWGRNGTFPALVLIKRYRGSRFQKFLNEDFKEVMTSVTGIF